MQTAKIPLVINSIIVMPMATQNSIKPIILFIMTSHSAAGGGTKSFLLPVAAIHQKTDEIQIIIKPPFYS